MSSLPCTALSVCLSEQQRKPRVSSVPQCSETGLGLNFSTVYAFSACPLHSTARTKMTKKFRCRHGGVFRPQGAQSGSPDIKGTPALPYPVEFLGLSSTLISARFYHASICWVPLLGEASSALPFEIASSWNRLAPRLD